MTSAPSSLSCFDDPWLLGSSIPAKTQSNHWTSLKCSGGRSSKRRDASMLDGKVEQKAKATVDQELLVGDYLRRHQTQTFQSLLEAAQLERCKEEVSNAQPVKTLFKLCDRDKNSTIDKREIRCLLGRVEVFKYDKIDRLFALMDRKRVEELQFEDFVEWLVSTAEDYKAADRADRVITIADEAELQMRQILSTAMVDMGM